MNVVIFDLGDTLVEYEGIPLNWEEHYEAALARLAAALGSPVTGDAIVQACAVLRRYNTRLHPRTEEVTFQKILDELCPCFGVASPRDELRAAHAFFDLFRQRLRCFPETHDTLARLRTKAFTLGVFTDVPYGMPRELVVEDLRNAGLEHAFDAIITSRDAGFRKPAPATLAFVATSIGCSAAEMTHVGNERKDIEVARAVGCRSILIDRHGRNPDWKQDRTLPSLAALGTL